jgi:hypothetical protein
MKNILFYFGKQFNSAIRFGEMIGISHACYFKAKELGYTNNNIYIEWTKVEYSYPQAKVFFSKPQDGYLPIKFLYNNEININEFDTCIDLDKENVFFKGCPPFNISEKKRYSEGMDDYLNKYYNDTGERPIFKVDKDKYNKFRILFNYRKAIYSIFRNVNDNKLTDLLKFFKDKKNKDTEFNITGDVSLAPKEFLNNFKNIYNPYIRDPSKLFRIINNSNLIVGASSGLADTANLFGIPTIQVDMPRKEKGGNPVHFSRDYWKTLSHNFGYDRYSWLDKNRYIISFEDENTPLLEISNMFDKIYTEWEDINGTKR